VACALTLAAAVRSRGVTGLWPFATRSEHIRDLACERPGVQGGLGGSSRGHALIMRMVDLVGRVRSSERLMASPADLAVCVARRALLELQSVSWYRRHVIPDPCAVGFVEFIGPRVLSPPSAAKDGYPLRSDTPDNRHSLAWSWWLAG
jgi:hypothetical protein